MKTIKHSIEFLFLLIFGFFILFLPLKVALCFARRLGDIAFYMLKIRKDIVIKNLTFAFPNKSFSEISEIARQTYGNFAMSMVELMLFPRFKIGNINKFVEFEGTEYLDEVLAKKQGMMLVGGHFGSWELLGAAICKKGYPMHVLILNQHNKLIDIWLNLYRKMMKIETIQLKVAIKTGLRLLKNGKFVAFISDQDAGKRDGIFVNFFGRPASTSQGPAVFALHTDVPVAMGFCIREPSYTKHRIKFVPVDFKRTGDYGKDIELLTLKYTQILEGFIKKYPAQWFWFHKRWKTVIDNMEKMY